MNRYKAVSEALPPDVAQHIRLLRQQQNFSQQELALASGLSRNTLSLLERGQTSPTLTTLQKIATALQVSINTFFEDVSRPESIDNSAGSDLQESILALSSDSGASEIEGLLSALIMRLEPNGRCGSLLPHSGKKYVYCLSGTCLITVDQQRHMLKPGESCLLDGRKPHDCQNLGLETAKILVILLDILA